MGQNVKEYMDAKLAETLDTKLKELQKKEAKDVVIKRENLPKEERDLVSKFYTALANGDATQLAEVNSLVSKEYKAKAQSEGTPGSGTAGGILVPTAVADSIVSKMKYISPIRQIATVISDMPAQLVLPSENTMATAYWVAEGAPITETSEVFDPNLLTPYKAAALDSFTSEIIADAATNPSIQNYVEQRFAVALALLENSAFTSGDGSGKPFGFRSSAITPNSVAQVGAAVTYADVVKLKYSLSTAYRSQAVYVTSSAGVMALENVKDAQGRPIWRDGLADGTPATLLGKPIYVVDEIPANLGGGTNATEVWFGVFTNYFIGDRGGLRVDYGTQGTDFAADKISLRVAKRVAGRPVIGEAFSKLTGVISA
jgi:HK97 family phage major capsid protein